MSFPVSDLPVEPAAPATPAAPPADAITATPWKRDPYVRLAIAAAYAALIIKMLTLHVPHQFMPDVTALNDFLSTILPLVIIGARAEVSSPLTFSASPKDAPTHE